MEEKRNAPVEKNKEYIVEIIDNGYEGEGIAKIEGFTIFIQGAIQGEKCKILILKVNQNFAYGKIIEIIEKSSRSNSTYEAVIELKYLNKEKAKTANHE